jgi:hypothetical protein
LAIEVNISYPGASSYPVGLDLYGVRYSTNKTVLTNDYALINSPSGTLIQNNVWEIPSSGIYPGETRETDASGDATLATWIAAQYTAGAVAGDYVFLRYATDTHLQNGFSIISADITSSASQIPVLTIITETGGASSHTLTASAVGTGTVSPTNISVTSGGSASFTVTAANYYRIASLTTNGVAVAGMLFDNNSAATNFTWSNVQADGALAVTFTNQVAGSSDTPYEWLASYGLTNGGATFDQAAVADTDQDGLQAWQEYIAGTVPTNAASSLTATQPARDVISWDAVAGRVYSVYWSTNLVSGFQALNTNIVNPQSSYTNPRPNVRGNYYQLKVRRE